MHLCRQFAELHWLLWTVPAVCGIGIAALGARIGHRSLAVLALLGAGWPLLQGLLAAVFVLWGPAAGFDPLVQIGWMTEQLFEISFSLDRAGVWGVCLSAAVTLAAQGYSLSAVARFAGRHRFYALLQLFLASSVLLFTSRSAVVVLAGWEAMALCAAFLAGFWESERSGARTGMRWLLFQRVSGLLLLLGLVLFQFNPQLGLWSVVLAALVRAGQMPFHGWLRDSADAPAPVGAVFYGAGSALAAVFLLDRFAIPIEQHGLIADAIGVVGIAGVVLALLAGLQQQQPLRALGWLPVMMGGFSLLAFSVGDPVAAILLVSSQTIVLAGLALAVGTLVGPVAEIRAAVGAPSLGRARRAYRVLAAAWVLPPSLGFVAMGRLLTASVGDPWQWAIFSAVCAGALAVGWITLRLHLQLSRWPRAEGCGSPEIGMSWAPAALASLTFGSGVAAVAVFGWEVVGGSSGVGWSALVAGASVLGALIGWLLHRGRSAWLLGRLTRTQRWMERVAETGLGIGELLVQLPVLTARALGVIVWRVISDVLIDTLIVGTAYKTVEGVGIALRMLQNGRIQRYALVAVAAGLFLLISMLR